MANQEKIHKLNQLKDDFNLKFEFEQKKQAAWTLPVVVTVFATSLGTAVPGGYSLGVINSPAMHMRAWCNRTLIEQYDFHLSASGLDLLWASVVSINLIFGMIGSLIGGRLADHFGRRGTFVLNAFILLIASSCFYFCRVHNLVPLLLLGRILIGLSGGITTTTLPMYHSEIAAVTQRGTLSVGTTMGFTLGTLLSQIMSLEVILGDAEHWHLALGGYVILVVIALVPFKYYSESPKYLYVLKNRTDEARLVLKRLRGNCSASVIDDEIDAMQLETSLQHQRIGYSKLWTDKSLRMPLLLLVTILVGQQFTGINAIFYYSDSIFRKAGLEPATAQWLNLGTGCINLCTSMLSPMLNTIFNRRTLLMSSNLICILFLVSFAIMENNTHLIDWFIIGCIASLYLYIVGFQLGLGTIPSFIGIELFEVATRSTALSFGNLLGWSSNFIVAMSFPIFQTLFGSWTFLLFAGNCAFICFVTKYYLPETRGRTTAVIAELVSHGFRRINK